MKTKELIPLLSEYFTTWLPDVKGVSKNTITAYQYAFQLLFEFMREVKGITFEKVTFSILLTHIAGIILYLSVNQNRTSSPVQF